MGFWLAAGDYFGQQWVKIDWRNAGRVLADAARKAAGVEEHIFEGAIIYASYNPHTEEGRRFKDWANGWLNRQAGVQVECRPRRLKRPPKCPVCYQEIQYCPHTDCGQKMTATVEKGVDTLIATDMIRLAWENAYDLAVLASADADFVPAVEFLNMKGRKIIQAGIPPLGAELAAACWASFDVSLLLERLTR